MKGYVKESLAAISKIFFEAQSKKRVFSEDGKTITYEDGNTDKGIGQSCNTSTGYFTAPMPGWPLSLQFHGRKKGWWRTANLSNEERQRDPEDAVRRWWICKCHHHTSHQHGLHPRSEEWRSDIHRVKQGSNNVWGTKWWRQLHRLFRSSPVLSVESSAAKWWMFCYRLGRLYRFANVLLDEKNNTTG